MVAVPADTSAHDMYGPESAQKRGTAPAFVRWVLPDGASTYDWAGEGGSTAIWPLVGPKKLVCRVRLHKYYVFPLRHVRHMAVRPLGHPPTVGGRRVLNLIDCYALAGCRKGMCY